MDTRPKVLIVAGESVRERYLTAVELERLKCLADVDLFESEVGGIYQVREDPDVSRQLAQRLERVEGLMVHVLKRLVVHLHLHGKLLLLHLVRYLLR